MPAPTHRETMSIEGAINGADENCFSRQTDGDTWTRTHTHTHLLVPRLGPVVIAEALLFLGHNVKRSASRKEIESLSVFKT